jgi:hypothetical protein
MSTITKCFFLQELFDKKNVQILYASENRLTLSNFFAEETFACIMSQEDCAASQITAMI